MAGCAGTGNFDDVAWCLEAQHEYGNMEDPQSVLGFRAGACLYLIICRIQVIANLIDINTLFPAHFLFYFLFLILFSFFSLFFFLFAFEAN